MSIGRTPALCCDPATVEDGLGGVQVGDKVKFWEEKQAYTVRAISTDRRWMICTKPFNLQHTVLYCVLDRVEQRRGPDNYYGLGYETPEDITAALRRFELNDAEVSVRHDVRLRVERVNGKPITMQVRESPKCVNPPRHIVGRSDCWRHTEGLVASR